MDDHGDGYWDGVGMRQGNEEIVEILYCLSLKMNSSIINLYITLISCSSSPWLCTGRKSPPNKRVKLGFSIVDVFNCILNFR